MALNKYMHPRNWYKKHKPNFKDLAIKYPEFRKCANQDLAGNVTLNFKDPTSLRALTTTLLQEDFGLKVELPLDRLIPTVPQRFNYIHWIEDILGKKGGHAKGIDIGTGASCIYPLLGCRLNNWQFLASEMDEQNLHYAKKNIEANFFSDKIQVKAVTQETMFIGLVEEDEQYDFSMCNPPFFSDHLEAQGISSSRSDDRPEPRSLSTASEGESIAWGGEISFVIKMIEESFQLNTKIRVYTTMLGKKISVLVLKDELKRRKVPKYSTTEFCQGKTMRWGLAWTFDETVEFPKSLFQEAKKEKPPMTFNLPTMFPENIEYMIPPIAKFFKKHFEELKIEYKEQRCNRGVAMYTLIAKENSWSNQRRKRREKQRQIETIQHINQESDFVETQEASLQEGSEQDENFSVHSMDEKSAINGKQGTGTVKDKVQFNLAHENFELAKYHIQDFRSGEVDRQCTVNEFGNSNLKEENMGQSATSVINVKKRPIDALTEGETEVHCKRHKTSSVTEQVLVTSASDQSANSAVEKTYISNQVLLGITGDTSNENGVGSNFFKEQEVIMIDSRAENSVGSNSSNPVAKMELDISCAGDNSENLIKESSSSLDLGAEVIKMGAGETIINTDQKPGFVLAKTPCFDTLEKEGGYILKCYFNLKKRGRTIYMEIIWVDGQNKEHMHQILQYLKNQVKLRVP
ncbi:hypothetical protein CHS0354_017101 [Potamilus streckersoni]|uniref:RNA N(6)-adenosine-methyltransferase METTL16 n=1 Tax=Potamilus streckersoni TaxID=2493646 RepID=A0AAE0SC23_9BIVA|nr:hypothetical protein CHS0354_017101 [Potamilus streckersoni]